MLAALFSGVGIGIALGTNMFWQACILTSPRKRYGKAPGRFRHDADCTYAFNALEKTRHHTNAIGKIRATDNEPLVVVTAILCMACGLRYHRRDHFRH